MPHTPHAQRKATRPFYGMTVMAVAVVALLAYFTLPNAAATDEPAPVAHAAPLPREADDGASVRCPSAAAEPESAEALPGEQDVPAPAPPRHSTELEATD